MDEARRIQRNKDRLTELFPTFRARLRRVIKVLEKQGQRPRIQSAWRSPEDQLAAYNSGHSKLKYGFHNATGANGKKEGLAVDLLDDNNPLNPKRPYLLRLAAASENEGLVTGIRWDLPTKLRRAIDIAIAKRVWRANVKIGWDPNHVQPTGISVDEAKNGKRPT